WSLRSTKSCSRRPPRCWPRRTWHRSRCCSCSVNHVPHGRRGSGEPEPLSRLFVVTDKLTHVRKATTPVATRTEDNRVAMNHLPVAPGTYERIGDFLRLLQHRGVDAREWYDPTDQYPLQIVIKNSEDLDLVLDLPRKNGIEFVTKQ